MQRDSDTRRLTSSCGSIAKLAEGRALCDFYYGSSDSNISTMLETVVDDYVVDRQLTFSVGYGASFTCMRRH